MAIIKTLSKWWQVYANDEEKRFFVGKNGISGLVRHPEFEWRSTDRLSSESGLTRARTEEIIDKYHKVGIVVAHKTDPEKWGYWENVDPDSGTQVIKSVAEADQEKRIEKASKK